MNPMMPTPMPEEEDEALDPQMQAEYEQAHHAMRLIVDKPETFKEVRSLLTQAQEAGMLVEQAAEAMVMILSRLEKETGPLDDGILMTLGEELALGVREDFGIEATDEEIQKILATGLGLWMKGNPDRVEMGAEETQMIEQGINDLAVPPGQSQQEPQQAPQQGGLLAGAPA